MWQRLLLTRITPIRLKQSEEIHEFHTPYRSDWGQLVSVDACFTVAVNAISKQGRSWPKAENLVRALMPAKNIKALQRRQSQAVWTTRLKPHRSAWNQPCGCRHELAGKDWTRLLHGFPDQRSHSSESPENLYSGKAWLLQLVCLFICVRWH